MSTHLPNLLMILCTRTEPSSLHSRASTYNAPACLVGTSWATNLVSLLSSSVPSHHRVWADDGKVGRHVDTLPVPLKRAGYRATFLGPREAISLAAQCGFDEVEAIMEGDGSVEAGAALHRPDGAPVLVTCMVPSVSDGWGALVSRLAMQGQRPAVVLVAGIQQRETAPGAPVLRPEAISTSLTVSIGGRSKHVDGADHLWSIIDLAPSLLGLIGVRVPYTMVGKDQHLYWHGKPRKVNRFPRARCLFEHEDGAKTTWNGRFLLTMHPGQEAGELFDGLARDGAIKNLWDDPSMMPVRNRLLLEFLWAQLDKECMPMPRIAGA